MLMELNAEEGTTLVVVTHSTELAQRFPRCLRLESGAFVGRPSGGGDA
jgi:predicted ABC-type transport system involved in lysophospholipase L1 biosynthesis ATPase subunit